MCVSISVSELCKHVTRTECTNFFDRYESRKLIEFLCNTYFFKVSILYMYVFTGVVS